HFPEGAGGSPVPRWPVPRSSQPACCWPAVPAPRAPPQRYPRPRPAPLRQHRPSRRARRHHWTPAGFYVTWQVDSQAKTPSSVLVRADQATGRIEAMHSFSTGSITRPFAVGTSLWAMLAMSHAELLLRMDPVTLAVTGELSVSSGSSQGATYRNNQLSVAGGA